MIESEHLKSGFRLYDNFPNNATLKQLYTRIIIVSQKTLILLTVHRPSILLYMAWHICAEWFCMLHNDIIERIIWFIKQTRLVKVTF